MSKNYLSKELGGKPQGLKFNLATLRFIGEITGKDAFEFSFDSTKLESLLEAVTVITQAALISNYKSKKQDVDFTHEEVKDWVEDLSVEDITEIATVYAQSYTVSGEASRDTQSAGAEVII